MQTCMLELAFKSPCFQQALSKSRSWGQYLSTKFIYKVTLGGRSERVECEAEKEKEQIKWSVTEGVLIVDNWSAIPQNCTPQFHGSEELCEISFQTFPLKFERLQHFNKFSFPSG